MNSAQILVSLERERQLLEEFHSISEQQLRLLDDENIDGVESLLGRRADLMVELTAIESTLGTWISQIRDDPSVTTDMMQELRFVNDEIVDLAKEVVAIDAETHWRLDLIRDQAKTELKDVNSTIQMLSQYGSSLEGDQPRLDLEC
jgi:hypothetical protein